MIVKSIRDAIAGRPLYKVEGGTTVREAAKLMAEHGIGALVVMRGDALAGIVTERDIAVRAVAEGLPTEAVPVSMIMTADPVIVGIDEPLSEALAKRIGGPFRHLPVLEEGRVVGILSFRDIPAECQMLFERYAEMAGGQPG